MRLDKLFFFDAVETSYAVAGIEGKIPAWLRGSYYLNGPARFERGGRRYHHWLDGDGMVCALHFTERGVQCVSRFVRTRKLVDETAAGTFVYRGFGTAFPGDRLHRGVMLESPVNINVCRWQDRLLAFGEQSLPIELDPTTLETRGPFDFQGQLNEVSPFAAHAKIDPATDNLLNFGVSFSASQPSLTLYEFNPRLELLRRARFRLELPHSNHDFGFTPGHAVFFLSPLIMDFARFVEAGASVMESLAWRPERGSRMLVVPRHPHTGQPFLVEAGQGYCLHLINAHESRQDLVVDILELERPIYGDYQPLPDILAGAPRSHAVRYVIDLDARTLRERRELPFDCSSDFPAIDPRLHSSRYDDFWMLSISRTGDPGPKFYDVLAHGSWSRGDVTDRCLASPGTCFAGEPAFIGNPSARDDGFVIVQQLDATTGAASFLLFDAFAVHRGPVIRIPLKHPMHPLFHAGFFASQGG